MKPKFLIVFILLFVFESCQIVPITKRPQVIFRSEKRLIKKTNKAYYSQIDYSYTGTKPLSKVEVNKVGKKMQGAIEAYFENHYGKNRIRHFSWDYSLVSDNEINAFSYPGGKIIFNSGIMPFCVDEVGIATVMGHEMAHAIAKHANERSSGAILMITVALPLVPLAFLLTGDHTIFRQSFNAIKFSKIEHTRAHEYEADEIGMVFMAMAGYNPEYAIEFWERMALVSNNVKDSYLSTHPTDEKRIENLKKFLPEAMKYYKP